jgi:hypothetical protein
MLAWTRLTPCSVKHGSERIEVSGMICKDLWFFKSENYFRLYLIVYFVLHKYFTSY